MLARALLCIQWNHRAYIRANTQENSMKQRTMNSSMAIGLFALAGLAMWAPSASATGMMAEIIMSDFTDELAEKPYPDMLLPLTRLEVTVEMSEAEAVIHESRSYRLDWNFYAQFAEVSFFRPLELGEGNYLVNLEIDGAPVEGTVLNVEEADTLRRSLVKNLREPGPLGEMGTRLFVSVPTAIDGWSFNPEITVNFTVHQPTVERSTMHGVDIPVDWHKTPVDFTSVHVVASGEEPVRALYAPYHQLSHHRVDAHELQGSYVGYERCTGFPITILIGVPSPSA